MKKKLLIATVSVCALLAVFATVFISNFKLVTADKDSYDKIFSSNHYTEDEVLGFEDDSYYSYLLSVPSAAPENITDMYFRYERSLFSKTVSMLYLSYTLGEDEYLDTKELYKNYSLGYLARKNAPIYTEDAFSYPAVVFTYMSEDDGIAYGVAEYVLFDDAENRIINVYYNGIDVSFLEDASGESLAAKESSVGYVVGDRLNIDIVHRGFSLYCFTDSAGKRIIPQKEEFVFAF